MTEGGEERIRSSLTKYLSPETLVAKSRKRTNYALEGVRLTISEIVTTAYPANVKYERLRALHMLLETFKSSIQSQDDWETLKALEASIFIEQTHLKSLIPKGVTIYF